jgi:hypothetical protein
MARLAEIKDASSKGQPARTAYINPLNVNSVEPIPGGTRITFNGGQVIQTSLDVTEVVGIIQNSMV